MIQNKLTASYWNITEQQWRFACEYLIDQNGTKAAQRAGYSPDNERAAQTTASRLLSNAMVLAAVCHLVDERTKRTMIDADWVLTKLSDAITADVRDLYDINGQLKPVHQWPDVWCTGLVAGLKIEPTLDLVGVNFSTSDIKLADRTKLLEMIGKHVDVQAFKDRVEVETDMTPWGSIAVAEHVRGEG